MRIDGSTSGWPGTGFAGWASTRCLAPEGAVQQAWLVFQERVAEGQFGPSMTREAFARIFPALIVHPVQDERPRQHAAKRDRSRLVHLSDLETDGYHAIDPGALHPEDRVDGREQARYLLGLLAREGEHSCGSPS